METLIAIWLALVALLPFKTVSRFVDCQLPDGRVIQMPARKCVHLGGIVIKPTPTVTPTPTAVPTVVPTATPTAAPTPPPAPPTIVVFNVYNGTSGESTYGYVTGVRAGGANIGFEARMTLRNDGVTYTGMYQGGDGYA